MSHSIVEEHPVGSIPAFMKVRSTQRGTGCVLALAAVFVLLFFLGNALGSEWLVRAPGQPTQMWSKVDYDPKLSDPFFESDEWSYPWWIIKHPDGHFEDTTSDKNPKKEPPRLKHTAKCFSTRFYKHVINFCEARVLDANTIELIIKHEGAAFIEIMRVHIRNGKFRTEYTAATGGPMSDQGPPPCTKVREELTLDKERYRKGDVMKGRIDFECVRRNPPGFKVYGVFKTVVK
jgi:hypothetical protein